MVRGTESLQCRHSSCNSFDTRNIDFIFLCFRKLVKVSVAQWKILQIFESVHPFGCHMRSFVVV
uniref:Uncharacterized protein n=1 Tax=Arundo donax TaxID=35708 RepID=A0A0A9D0E8_ARUDO